jgi:endonuclease-3
MTRQWYNAAMADKKYAATILRRLAREYPDARCALDHRDAWTLLSATILSAQCTDARVNQVTPALFARYPDAAAMARAKQADVQKLVRSTGFYRNKAKALIASSRGIVEQFGGQVPRTMDELLTLRGVARKTANVVLSNAFGLNEGVVVDTHVARLSARMGLTRHSDPRRIEQDLVRLLPRAKWGDWSHLMIFHGRRVCAARKPACDRCVIADLCPRLGVKP